MPSRLLRYKLQHRVTPYLIVQGAAQLTDFPRQAFDAKETERMAAPSSPRSATGRVKRPPPSPGEPSPALALMSGPTWRG